MKSKDKAKLEQVVAQFKNALIEQKGNSGIVYAYVCGTKILSISIEEIDFDGDKTSDTKEA